VDAASGPALDEGNQESKEDQPTFIPSPYTQPDSLPCSVGEDAVHDP